MQNQANTTIQYLEIIAPILPAPIYWLDRNGVILGANELTLKAIGFDSLSEVVGKTVYDLYPYEIAEHISQHDQQVIKTGQTLRQEEAIKHRKTGDTHYYTAVKTPLRNEDGDIIGLIGTSIEVTVEKEAERVKIKTLKKQNIIKYLELIAASFPAPLYWNDRDSVVLGINQLVLKATGASSASDFLGKSPYEIYPREIADKIVKHNDEVIRTEQILGQEEPIVDLSTGKTRYYTAVKAPLRDEDGTIIGTLGTSIEITAQKEAEQREMEAQKKAELLKFENETQKLIAQEQEKFGNLARKVAHDINSPLAALKVMIDLCDELPEDKRNLLRRATESILDIGNNLIANYHTDNYLHDIEVEPRQSLLVSDLLVQILSEKKIQYRDYPVRFETVIAGNAQFAFIHIQKSEFRRAISNLINNAVDALKEKNDGVITVLLSATGHAVMVAVQDNGKGMSKQNVQKMQRRRYFTDGKENGHGLGLQQVWDMLQANRGRLAVQSTLEQGTNVKLTFSRASAAKWVAQEMRLVPNQIIAILDDEQSIHDAWNMHFTPLLTTHSQLRLHHFTQGQEVLNFMNGLTPSEKEQVMLLSDYELLHQSKNGLEIIQNSSAQRAILVTSHYTNPAIRDAATKLKIKILPKQMASIIPIHVE